MIKMSLKRKKGFTLPELIAVFIILSIILTLSIVAYNKNVDENAVMSHQMEAKAMTDPVVQYIQLNNGQLPTDDNYTDGYASIPVKLDLTDIEFLLSKDVPKIEGNFYIYGYNHEVFYDLPTTYVYDMYKKYEQDTGIKALIGKDVIDTDLLYSKNYLPYKTITNYVLDEDKAIQESK